MEGELERTVYLAVAIDEYQGFFFDDWAKVTAQKAKSAKRLDELVFDLIRV